MPWRRSALSEYYCILKAVVACFLFYPLSSCETIITSVLQFPYLSTISSGPFLRHRQWTVLLELWQYISVLKPKKKSFLQKNNYSKTKQVFLLNCYRCLDLFLERNCIKIGFVVTQTDQINPGAEMIFQDASSFTSCRCFDSSNSVTCPADADHWSKGAHLDWAPVSLGNISTRLIQTSQLKDNRNIKLSLAPLFLCLTGSEI